MLKDKFNIELDFISEDNLILHSDVHKGDSYGFKYPVEHPNIPYHYVIPTMLDLAISANGNLVNVKTNRSLKFCITKAREDKNVTGGYYINRRGSRHRMMCLAFKRYDDHPGKLWVNHRNGIPGDDLLPNLEWATPSENVKHAYDNGLHKRKTRSVFAKYGECEETFYFNTITKAALHTGISFKAIVGRLTRSNANKYPDNWRFSLLDQWDTVNNRYHIAPNEKKISCLDIRTGVILEYPNAQLCSEVVGVLSGTIIAHSRKELTTPLNGYLFRYANTCCNFPTLSDLHLRLIKHQNYPTPVLPGVIGFDANNHEIFFGTLSEACVKFNYSDSGLRNIIRSGKLINDIKLELISFRI